MVVKAVMAFIKNWEEHVLWEKLSLWNGIEKNKILKTISEIMDKLVSHGIISTAFFHVRKIWLT